MLSYEDYKQSVTIEKLLSVFEKEVSTNVKRMILVVNSYKNADVEIKAKAENISEASKNYTSELIDEANGAIMALFEAILMILMHLTSFRIQCL